MGWMWYICAAKELMLLDRVLRVMDDRKEIQIQPILKEINPEYSPEVD